MLLKRSMILSAGVLLFILAFFLYFQIVNAQMEGRFRQERQKFNVDGMTLTTTEPAVPVPVPAAPAAPPAPAPASGTTVDTNILIGPVPPPSSATPDTAPVPSTAPTTPDPNSAPMTPPPSTLNAPRENHSPFFVLTAYHPSDGLRIQAPSPEQMPAITPAAPAPPLISPATNTPNSGAAPTTGGTNTGIPPTAGGTNTAPYAVSGTESGTPRPAAVEPSVIVLLYHQFVPAGASVPPKMLYTMNQDVFESEMKYLHDNGYHVVSIADVIRFLKHEIGLPPNSVAITIDDGYKSAIVYAAPILKKYNFPWTFFIYPDFITTTESKGAASWNDLLALQADGVDIECHSMRHPFLAKLHQQIKGVWYTFSPEEYEKFLDFEIVDSKALLEQKMGKPITCFAYPYGDYNKQVEAKVIAAGYEAIFTVADNPVHATTSLHSIGRYTMSRPVEKNFAAYLHQGALGIAEADPAPGTTTNDPRPVITAVLGYAGNLDAKSIETDVRDYGSVRHDFDPKTSTVRLYLPRDLVQPTNLVNIRVKDADTGQVMVANWHFNYEPAGAAANAVHPPIAPATNAPSATTTAAPASKDAPASKTPAAAVTNATSTAVAPTSVPAKAPTGTSVTGSKASSR